MTTTALQLPAITTRRRVSRFPGRYVKLSFNLPRVLKGIAFSSLAVFLALEGLLLYRLWVQLAGEAPKTALLSSLYDFSGRIVALFSSYETAAVTSQAPVLEFSLLVAMWALLIGAIAGIIAFAILIPFSRRLAPRPWRAMVNVGPAYSITSASASIVGRVALFIGWMLARLGLASGRKGYAVARSGSRIGYILARNGSHRGYVLTRVGARVAAQRTARSAEYLRSLNLAEHASWARRRAGSTAEAIRAARSRLASTSGHS